MTMQEPNGHGQSQALVRGPQARFQKISDVLFSKKDAIGALLPKHLTAERLLRVALSACSRNPDLLDCTPQSLVLALAIAAYLGIEPNMPNGRGYLIPRVNNKTQGGAKEATFLLGYKGILYLAMNSGKVASIESQVVYEKEEFRVRLGTDSIIEHERRVDAARGNPVAFYAVAKYKSGERIFEVMSLKEVYDIRDRSPAGQSGPWVTDTLQMGRKSAIRRLGNYLVLDDEKFDVGVRADNAADGESAPDFSDILEGQVDGAGKALAVGDGGETPALPQTGDRGQALADQLSGKAKS